MQRYSLDGTTVFWNQASERLYGYNKSEALGRNILNLIIPDSMKNEVRNAIASMCVSGEAIPSSELRLRRKDGSAVDVFSCHAIIVNTLGVHELYCMDLDIADSGMVPADTEEEARRERCIAFSLIDKLAGLADFDLDMTTILDLLAYELKVAFNADHCFITLWDDKKCVAIPFAGSGTSLMERTEFFLRRRDCQGVKTVRIHSGDGREG